MDNNNFDPLTRAIRCEKCGEWWYQGTPHGCKPSSQLDEAVRDRDKRIADLMFVIAELNTRLSEEGRYAVNQNLLEKDHKLMVTFLGSPTSPKEYDIDAEMIAQMLREHFVNVHVKVFSYSEMEGQFAGRRPWFFRFRFTVLGKEIFQDIDHVEWYDTADKLRIIYMVEKVLMNSLLNYIMGRGLRNTK